MRSLLFSAAFAALFASPAMAEPKSQSAPVVTADVPAFRETAPVPSQEDAADDPALWRNAKDPAKSLIVATDKKSGLQVYGLDGALLAQTPGGLLNNVDLRDGVMINGAKQILVAASDRNDNANGHIAFYTLNPAANPMLAPLARLPAGDGEAYGFCLWRRRADQALFAFVPFKDGRVRQFALDFSGPTATATQVREIRLASQPEGCVADDRTGLVYLGEEDVGIWRVAAAPDASAIPVEVAKVDGVRLVADVEGLALAPQGRSGGLLIASSQGDNAYAAFRLKDFSFVGRFRIGPSTNGAVDGTYETDGIELILGDFGKDYPGGVFIAQDGDNAPETQNFKMISWKAAKRALRR